MTTYLQELYRFVDLNQTLKSNTQEYLLIEWHNLG